MPNLNTLSKKEREFAKRVAQGEDPRTAMLNSGYSKLTIRNTGAAVLLRRQRVRDEIERCKLVEGTLVGQGPLNYDGFSQELKAILMEKPVTEDQLEELRRCADKKTGLEYWLQNYVWTWDKVNKSKAQYPLWPFQSNFLAELQVGGQIIVEKSRDLMVTWTVCEYILWHLQFDPYWTGFATSRRETEVDNGGASSTTASIFGRIRFSWQAQPPWMRFGLRFSRLKIVNEEDGMFTEVVGESANINVGRSSDVYFKWGDEFSLVEQSELAHASMVGGGFHTLLYTSTSNLTGNEFYRLRSKKDSGFHVLRYSWEDRPDHDKEWYAKKSASMSAEQKAKELDITYEIKGPRQIWKQFDPRIHVVTPDKIPVEMGYGIIGYDEGYASPGALYYARYWGQTLYIIDEVYKPNIQLLNPETLRDDMDHDWVWYIDDFIDRHGQVSAISVGPESRGFEAILTSRGHRVYRVGQDKRNRIRLVDSLFSGNGNMRPGVLISEECTNLLKEIPHYKWKVTAAGVLLDVPADGVDHAVDALQYIAEYVMEEQGTDDGEGNWVSKI